MTMKALTLVLPREQELWRLRSQRDGLPRRFRQFHLQIWIRKFNDGKIVIIVPPTIMKSKSSRGKSLTLSTIFPFAHRNKRDASTKDRGAVLGEYIGTKLLEDELTKLQRYSTPFMFPLCNLLKKIAIHASAKQIAPISVGHRLIPCLRHASYPNLPVASPTTQEDKTQIVRMRTSSLTCPRFNVFTCDWKIQLPVDIPRTLHR